MSPLPGPGIAPSLAQLASLCPRRLGVTPSRWLIWAGISIRSRPCHPSSQIAWASEGSSRYVGREAHSYELQNSSSDGGKTSSTNSAQKSVSTSGLQPPSFSSVKGSTASSELTSTDTAPSSESAAENPSSELDRSVENQDSISTGILRVLPLSNGDRKRLAQEVKSIMRHVPHPIAIITSTDTSLDPDGRPSSWRGATISSFNTVTLLPTVIVSFNIKKLSSTYEAIKSSGLFNVHLFDCTASSVAIAQKFSRANPFSPFHKDDGNLESFAHQAGGILDARIWNQAHKPQVGREPPRISSSPEDGYILRCQFLPDKAVEISDSMVVFGQVLHHRDLTSKNSNVVLYYVNQQYCPSFSEDERGRLSTKVKERCASTKRDRTVSPSS